MMIGNRDVELAVKLGGQADVGTVLRMRRSPKRVAPWQFRPGDIAGGVFTPPSLRHERSEAG